MASDKRLTVNVVRTRKYRIDKLVHIATFVVEGERWYRLECTRFNMRPHQVVVSHELATCITCIANMKGLT